MPPESIPEYKAENPPTAVRIFGKSMGTFPMAGSEHSSAQSGDEVVVDVARYPALHVDILTCLLVPPEIIAPQHSAKITNT
jgi:hypothetical protein